jgi:hypothetical protein
MGVKVAKDAIDLGIVTTNGPAMLAFYRDVADRKFKRHFCHGVYGALLYEIRAVRCSLRSDRCD